MEHSSIAFAENILKDAESATHKEYASIQKVEINEDPE